MFHQHFVARLQNRGHGQHVRHGSAGRSHNILRCNATVRSQDFGERRVPVTTRPRERIQILDRHRKPSQRIASKTTGGQIVAGTGSLLGPLHIRRTITPEQLPPVYTPSGSLVFASGDSKQVPGNTVMDVLRFEQDLAALSPDHQITPLSVFGMAQNFQNGYIGTWTAGVEQKLGGATLNAAYVGTAGIKLPVMDYPNGYIGADPTSAPYTQFDSSGAIVGGYGSVVLMTNRSHSTYHSLQVSAQRDLTASGLGFQGAYCRNRASRAPRRSR